MKYLIQHHRSREFARVQLEKSKGFIWGSKRDASRFDSREHAEAVVRECYGPHAEIIFRAAKLVPLKGSKGPKRPLDPWQKELFNARNSNK